MKKLIYIVCKVANGEFVRSFDTRETAWRFILNQDNPLLYYWQKAWMIEPAKPK